MILANDMLAGLARKAIHGRWLVTLLCEAGREPGAGAGFAQAGFQNVVHAPWLLPWLRAVVTAITVTAVRSDSSSAAHWKARRLDIRPAGRRA